MNPGADPPVEGVVPPASDHRPALPPSEPIGWGPPLLTGALLAAVVLALMAPILPVLSTDIIGDTDTDAIRGMWSFDHVRRSLLPPDALLWSEEINFPRGVLALVLPQLSGVLAAPVGLFFGPIAGWNLALMALLWTLGLSTAWLARVISGSWIPGAIAGAAMLSQPMLLHALADGTPEHVAFWLVPFTLAVAAIGIRTGRPALGALTGLLAGLVAVDSPYHAVFAVIPGLLMVVTTIPRKGPERLRTDLVWTFVAMVAGTALSALLVVILFRNFSLSEAWGNPDAATLLVRNAADLSSWWRADWGEHDLRETGLAPTNIPVAVLLPCTVLAIIGGWRGQAWLAAATFMVLLSFGINDRLGTELTYWLGDSGEAVGATVARVNTVLYRLPGLHQLRFPQRWLVPAALALLVGASFGLARLLRLLPRKPAFTWVAGGLAALLAAGAASAGYHNARYCVSFPSQHLPTVTFADWLADQPGHGAVLILPQMRSAPATGRRGDVPVFAHIADNLASSDMQFLQAMHGRPTVAWPNLKTLAAFPVSDVVYRQYRHWDDLTHPKLTGNPIPRAASDLDELPTRRSVVEYLYEHGLRYVAVDLGCYDDEALGILRQDFADHLSGERTFDDGDGVLILELGEF